MSVDSFNQLFTHMLRDVYGAEKQHTKALPKLAKQSSHPQLQRAFQEHLNETKEQIQRLEQIFEMLGERPRSEKCEGAEGLIMEAQETLDEVSEEPLRDAAMLASAQTMEHYEIARYGTLLAWAETMGQRKIARLLSQFLKEEERADDILNRLAEGQINEQASQIDGAEAEDGGGGRSRTARGRSVGRTQHRGKVQAGKGTSRQAARRPAPRRGRRAAGKSPSGNGRQERSAE